MKNKLNHHPHDKLVAMLLKDPNMAIDLFKNSLSKQYVANLDLSTLTLSSETAVSPEWKKYYHDIVFRCQTKKKKDTYIYILLEHLSNPYRFMPMFVLRYKIGVLSKHLDAKKKPKKLPNVICLVLFHGKKEYPYKTDIFSCFEDEELARQSFQEPMILLDLAKMSEQELLSKQGSDTVLKILLKYSRDKRFIQKIEGMMRQYPNVFVDLSPQQATYIFEYIMHVGKGTPKNAASMRESFNQTYGPEKAEKIFSLADYFKQEGRKEGKKEGRKEGKIALLHKLESLGVSQDIIAKIQEED